MGQPFVSALTESALSLRGDEQKQHWGESTMGIQTQESQ